MLRDSPRYYTEAMGKRKSDPHADEDFLDRCRKRARGEDCYDRNVGKTKLSTKKTTDKHEDSFVEGRFVLLDKYLKDTCKLNTTQWSIDTKLKHAKVRMNATPVLGKSGNSMTRTRANTSSRRV